MTQVAPRMREAYAKDEQEERRRGGLSQSDSPRQGRPRRESP